MLGTNDNLKLMIKNMAHPENNNNNNNKRCGWEEIGKNDITYTGESYTD